MCFFGTKWLQDREGQKLPSTKDITTQSTFTRETIDSTSSRKDLQSSIAKATGAVRDKELNKAHLAEWNARSLT